MEGQLRLTFVILTVLLGLQELWLPYNQVNCLKQTIEPQNLVVHLQQTIVLDCKIEKPVDKCQWKRNDFPITMGGRYSGINQEEKNTTKCLLEIADISNIDFGTWMCFGKKQDEAFVYSKPIKLVNNRFVVVRGNHSILLVDKVYLTDEDELEVICTLEGINKAAASYLWEYRKSSNVTWEVHSTEHTTALSVLKLGYFRCSVLEGNFRYYSLEYDIAKSDSKESLTAGFVSQRTTYLLIGFIVGMISMVLIGIAAIKFKSLKRFNEKKNDSKGYHEMHTEKNEEPNLIRETEPLLNISEVITKTSQKIDQPSPGGTLFDWKIDNYRKKLLDETTGTTPFLCSSTFNVERTEYYFRAKLYLNGLGDEKSSFMAILLEIANRDINPNNHFHHKRKILLLDQSGNGRHMCWEHEPNYKSDEVQSWMIGFWGPVDFFPIATLKYDDQTFIRNGSINIRVIIEPMLKLSNPLILESYSNGFIWKIDNYLQRLQDEYDNFCRCIESEPFYCYPGGYRAKCVVYLNGCGKGKSKYISIFYGFLNGEHDNELPPAFSHRAILRILDQSDFNNGKHIEKKYTLRCDDPATDEDKDKMSEFQGFLTFAERKKIQREPFVVDDSLMIQVLIKPLNNKQLLKNHSSYSLESEKIVNTTAMRTDAV